MSIATPTTTPKPVDDTAARPLRCFLVEDNAIIRRGLAAALEDQVAVQVVGMAEDERGAIAWLRKQPPGCELLIIDIFLRQGNGLDVLRQARALQPEMRRVVLTNFATDAMRRCCIALGADRVFDKSMELAELLAYCESLQSG